MSTDEHHAPWRDADRPPSLADGRPASRAHAVMAIEPIDRPRAGHRVRSTLDRWSSGSRRPDEDWLATEEPLEIRLAAGGRERPLATTMRTPGHDWDLAAGFLVSEGFVHTPTDITAIRYCGDDDTYNVVTVDLRRPDLPDLGGAARYGTITSACGVCGRATLDDLEGRGLRPVPPVGQVDPALLTRLPDRLRAAQAVFDATGGLHAAAWFSGSGDLESVREDVGRHNALDKLIGASFLDGRLPMAGGVVMVSGRASFELVQKAVAAGATTLAAVSAPSSLAVDTARRFGLTLVGFLRGDRFNVYAGAERVT